jgi:hypothetical protein
MITGVAIAISLSTLAAACGSSRSGSDTEAGANNSSGSSSSGGSGASGSMSSSGSSSYHGGSSGGSDASGGSSNSGDSSGSGGSAGSSGSTGSSGSGGSSDAGGSGGPSCTVDGGGGGNTISGSTSLTHFTSIATALWIQNPDSPVTTIVYLFSKPVQCSAISVARWDEISGQIPNATEYLELKVGWPSTTQPNVPPTVSYNVTHPVPNASANPPPPGESWNFAGITAQPNPGSEVISTSGAVTQTAINPNVNVTGTFSVTFDAPYNPGAGMLCGTYDATWCPGGREP